MRYPSICFVAQKAFGVLANQPSIYLGGVEVQIPLMARWFVDRGYDVSMICWESGFGEETNIDGVRVLSMCDESDGYPGLRFVTPRWTSLVDSLRRANADIVYYNYGDLILGQIALWVGARGIPLVYSVPNDMVCKRDLPTLHLQRERTLYRYGLNHSDLVIAQTTVQKRMLWNDFGIDATHICMPSEGFPASDRVFPATPAEIEVLWVGRFTSEKRLEWLLDVASKMPDIRFKIVGGTSVATDYSKSLSTRMADLTNVDFAGRHSQAEMGADYNRATILCSTSTYEGFPNVFLEAWSTGLPVVATVDPDGVIESHGLGRTATSVDGLVDAIRTMVQEDIWTKASAAAKEYFEKYHRVENVMEDFKAVIDRAYDLKREKIGTGIPRQLLRNPNAPVFVAETSASQTAKPTFSVVTATFRRARELEQLLESIVDQLGTDPERFEHVICDNASDDNTADVVRSYIERNDHLPIRYFRQTENYGLDKNIQDALGLTRGEYVWFVADDDDIAPGKLSYVADTCEQLQLPMVIVRANNIADWESVPRMSQNSDPVIIDPTDPRWSRVIYATSFLASMVFRRDGIEQYQQDLLRVYGTNYTPWGLGLRIISNAARLGYIDELCTLGNANFDGKNRFPAYKTLIKGRVQVWDHCAEGKVYQNLRSHLERLANDGWRALAAGKLQLGDDLKTVFQEYTQMHDLLGNRIFFGLPWILIAVIVPRQIRQYLDGLRLKLTKGASVQESTK